MRLTPIHVVQANQIRQVRRVLLSGHLYHRVRPFQAFQADLATSLHRHRTHFPFLDRIAADDDEIIISRKGAISSHDGKNNNNNNNEVTTSKLQASLLIKWKRFKCSLCGRLDVSFDLWIVSETDASSDIIAAAHYVTAAHKILIMFVSGKKSRGNSKETFILNGTCPTMSDYAK